MKSPPALIINWDQTGINYVPVSSWTMEVEGSKRVELVGKDDKRQITAVFAGSMVGDFYLHSWCTKGRPHAVCLELNFLKVILLILKTTGQTNIL